MKVCMSAIKAALLSLTMSASLGLSQNSAPPAISGSSAPWQSDSVVYVAGLADVRPESVGTLILTSTTLVFSTKGSQGEIPFSLITGVSTGQERVATGGTGAKVVRKIPIFGIGAITGAATNKSVDLLTVEFRDIHGGYHGAVFEVPKTQAAIAQQQLLSFTQSAPVNPPATCDGQILPNTVLVSPIISAGIDLPAEYRVLLYEQMVEELKKSSGNAAVLRMGDVTAPCAAAKLRLSVTAFNKGNETVRASTGPVGLFIGATSVKFHVDLVAHDGAELFEKDLKESKHGDSDSLSVTHDLAKSVSKRLKKAKQIGTPSGS
jgi:hypothetical protein